MGSSGGLKQDLDNYLSRSSTSGKSSGISLPTATLGKWFRKNEDEEAESFLGTSKVSSFFPTLTRFQRLIGFCICLSMSSICFVLAALYLPVLVFKARKFAMLFTLASLFFLSRYSGFIRGVEKSRRIIIDIGYPYNDRDGALPVRHFDGAREL